MQKWGLDNRAARYLLDIALNPKEDEENRRKAAEALLSHLQNPALIVGLLAGRHDQFLVDKINEFLNAFQARVPKDATEESRREAARTAFNLYTPLNITIIPLLTKFRELVEQAQESLPLPAEPEPAPPILSLSWTELEASILEDGHAVFSALKAALQLEPMPASLHPLLLEPEVRTVEFSTPAKIKPPYFELMCRLYYFYEPSRLVTFVKTALSSYVRPASPAATSSTPVSRCLYVLPPISSVTTAEQIAARVELYLLENESLTALRELLSIDKFTEALSLVRSRSDQNVEHYELFHVLLLYCLERGNAEQVSAIWDVMPRQYSILDLIRVVSLNLPRREKPPSVIASGPGELPLFVFIPKFRELAEKMDAK